MIDRRHWLGSSAALLAAASMPGQRVQAAGEPAPARTLRVAFNSAETSFDPVLISDYNSNCVASCIFESPLTFDYLARPVKLRLQTAAAMPEISADFKTFTFRIRPGIFFADDPAFNGQARERALKNKTSFDYDTPVDGIRALGRYTFRVKLAEPGPRFHFVFAIPSYTGAVAREVIEAHADEPGAHPVGTGPFKLGAWRRASSIELLRNPGFREQHFEAEPAAGDEHALAIARELAGQRLPRVDRVEISVIDEAQPRWLAFLNDELDLLELPSEFAPVAVPNGKLAPHLAKKGVRLQRALQADMQMTYFNMDDATVGGNTPPKVALRRAVALAYDNDEANRLARNGQAIAAQSVVSPFTSGYDADYRSEMGQHNRTRAMALLDLFGYVDRDGDGWREQPDGSPLLLRLASTPDQRSRNRNELWRKYTAAIGVRMVFDIATWPDLLKKSRAGSVMMWGFIWVATTPDGSFFLGIGYGPNASESNDARFSLPEYDRLFERQAVLPDGPERDALMKKAKNLLVAYMPYKAHAHNIVTDLQAPRVRGHWRHPFTRDLWRYVGVDGTVA